MSFLNSVLNNIGKEGQRPPPILPPLQNKRKADEEIAGPNGKAIKSSSMARPSLTPGSVAPASINSTDRALKPPPVQTVPYRGTSKPASSSTPATPTAEPAKHLKKGSFKEIMARAKAAKNENKPVIGTITHKPRDKMEMSHKKELKMKKKALRDKKLGKVRDNSRPSSSDGSRNSSTAPGDKAKEKKIPQPTYSGTANAKSNPRPQPSYKGTMGARPTSAKPIQKAKPKRNVNEYAGTDDELDSYGEDEDDGYGYLEEESDDMEAGFSDVEQEETTAMKIARKEDEDELRKEAQLKKEKDAKRARLEALAKKAKPQRY